MGFGLLFIGYALSFVFSLFSALFAPYGSLIGIAGQLITALALLRLFEYERKYLYAIMALVPLFSVGVASLAGEVMSLVGTGVPEWITSDTGILSDIRLVAETAFNLTLLYVTAGFAGRLELKKQRVAALRNMIIIGIYFLIYFFGITIFSDSAKYSAYLMPPALLLKLVWIALNMILIFSCYMYICPEGDEEMVRKKTNIKALDKILAESDRRFEKASRETTEYYSGKIKSKRDKAKTKKKK